MGTTTTDAAAKPPEDPQAARRKALAEMIGRAEEAAKAKRYGEAIGICRTCWRVSRPIPPLWPCSAPSPAIVAT